MTRASLSSTETQGNGPSFSSAISPNGQFVAFLSQAADLAGGSGAIHVFLRDLLNGNTFLVSRADGAAGALGTSDVRPSVANDGTVAFASITGGLVAGGADTNGVSDVFLRLGATGGAPTTIRVSVSAAGAQLTVALDAVPSISADGQLRRVRDRRGSGDWRHQRPHRHLRARPLARQHGARLANRGRLRWQRQQLRRRRSAPSGSFLVVHLAGGRPRWRLRRATSTSSAPRCREPHRQCR